MKYLGYVFVVLFLLSNCNKDKDEEHNDGEVNLIGSWTYIEVLQDPGDGSGTFQPVTSDKTVTFISDGTLVSNGNICDMSIESNQSSSATYDETAMTFTSTACTNQSPLSYSYEIVGQELILKYPCFEACQAKFDKVE